MAKKQTVKVVTKRLGTVTATLSQETYYSVAAYTGKVDKTKPHLVFLCHYQHKNAKGVFCGSGDTAKEAIDDLKKMIDDEAWFGSVMRTY